MINDYKIMNNLFLIIISRANSFPHFVLHYSDCPNNNNRYVYNYKILNKNDYDRIDSSVKNRLQIESVYFSENSPVHVNQVYSIKATSLSYL